jgi:hypothetical protein
LGWVQQNKKKQKKKNECVHVCIGVPTRGGW